MVVFSKLHKSFLLDFHIYIYRGLLYSEREREREGEKKRFSRNLFKQGKIESDKATLRYSIGRENSLKIFHSQEGHYSSANL